MQPAPVNYQQLGNSRAAALTHAGAQFFFRGIDGFAVQIEHPPHPAFCPRKPFRAPLCGPRLAVFVHRTVLVEIAKNFVVVWVRHKKAGG
jgi:hypothetical protein